jgi:hypothetical protein
MCWQADGQFGQYWCAVEVEAKGDGSRSGSDVDSIQVREGSQAGNEGKNRRLMSSGVPFSGGPSEAIDDEAAEGWPRDTVMSSPDGEGGMLALESIGDGKGGPDAVRRVSAESAT